MILKGCKGLQRVAKCCCSVISIVLGESRDAKGLWNDLLSDESPEVLPSSAQGAAHVHDGDSSCEAALAETEQHHESKPKA